MTAKKEKHNKLYVRQLRIAIFDAFFIYSRLLKLFRHLFAILRDGVQLAALTKHFQSASLRFGYIILIARDDPRKLSLFFRRRADPFYRRQNRARLVVPKTAAVRRQVVRSDQYAVYAFNLQYLLDILYSRRRFRLRKYLRPRVRLRHIFEDRGRSVERIQNTNYYEAITERLGSKAFYK